MGLGLSGTPGLGRSGTRDSDYRERGIVANPQKAARNHAPSNYANREESFGFLLTPLGRVRNIDGGEGGRRPIGQPVDLLESVIRTSCFHSGSAGDWFVGSGSVGEARHAIDQRSFGCAIDAGVAARAKDRIAATVPFEGAPAPRGLLFGDQQ